MIDTHESAPGAASQPLIPEFNFAALAADIQADIDNGGVAEIAEELLSGVFRLTTEEGTVRTFEQIDAETETIWSNPLVQQIDGLAAEIAQRHAAFCAGHGRESTVGDNPNQESGGHDESMPHNHGKDRLAKDEDEDDEEDEDTTNGRSTSRSRRRRSRRSKVASRAIRWFGSKK